MANKKGTKEQQTVIQNVIVRPVQRTTQDIQKWRNALQSAESTHPQRIRLYDLYADLLLDAMLSAIIDKRILGVTKTKLKYLDKKGEEVEEMSSIIEQEQFRKLRKEIMLQKFWGISALELSVEDGKLKVFSIPRKHIKPEMKKIVWDQNGTEGISYDKPPYSKFILTVGNEYDLGLFLKTAPYVIYKRGNFGDWSKFAEIFGMPFREARYDGYNDAVRVQLEKALDAAGSASYAILPEEAKMEFHETKNTSATGQLYNMLRTACNEELATLILGQTQTTMSNTGSGYAQSKTHAGVEDDINENDRMDELSILNERLQPILQNLGLPAVDGGYFDHDIPDEQLSKKDQATVIVQLKKGLNLPISDDYLYENFGIPKPDNYEELKQQPQPDHPVETDGRPSPDNDKSTAERSRSKRSRSKRKLSFLDKQRLKLDRFFH